MAINYSVLNYTVNVLVEKTMKKYDCDYQSALQAVLNSKMYERLITDADFLDEGDIFLFNILSKELDANWSILLLVHIFNFYLIRVAA